MELLALKMIGNLSSFNNFQSENQKFSLFFCHVKILLHICRSQTSMYSYPKSQVRCSIRNWAFFMLISLLSCRFIYEIVEVLLYLKRTFYGCLFPILYLLGVIRYLFGDNGNLAAVLASIRMQENLP